MALVLSLINSAVLLAMLGGLGGAGYLAKTGRLEGALQALSSPFGSSDAQGFFALVSASSDLHLVPEHTRQGGARQPVCRRIQ